MVLGESYHEHGGLFDEVRIELCLAESRCRGVKRGVGEIELCDLDERLDVEVCDFGGDGEIVGELDVLELTWRVARAARGPLR